MDLVDSSTEFYRKKISNWFSSSINAVFLMNLKKKKNFIAKYFVN